MFPRIAALLLSLFVSGSLFAQAWPTGPVKLVVPFPPGGSVDTYARLMGKQLAERLGKPVVIENRAGAGGSVGSELVARSKPDGYTIVWGTVSSHAINNSLYTKIRYDNIKDFAPITQLMEQPLLVVVPVNSPIRNLPDLQRVLQTRSMHLRTGTPGVGTTGHLTMELLKKQTGGDLTHVGYKGSNPMLTDLIGGHIDMGMDNFPSAVVQVRGGKLRAIAVTSEKRSPLLPDVPALNEVVPGAQAVAWQGMFAPAGTPDEIVARLEREIIAILGQPDYVAALAESGSTPTPKPRAEFANFVKAETARWSEIVKASGAKADE